MAGNEIGGGGELTPERMRNNLLASFRGRAARDGIKDTEAEAAGINYIRNMTDEQVISIMSDSKLSDSEFNEIKRDGKKAKDAQMFEMKGEVTEADMDAFVNGSNQALADASTSGVLHEMRAGNVTASRNVGNTGEVKADGVKEEKAWYEKAWDFVKENPVKVGVGVAALAGAAVLAFVPGAQGFAAGLFGGGSKLLTAALVVGGAASLASCGKDPVPGDEKTVINQTVNITITKNEDIATLLDYIASIEAEIREGNKTQEGKLTEIIKLISQLILQDKTNAAEIIKLCGTNNALLETVISLLIENNEILKGNNALIKEFMEQQGNDNKAILEALIALQNSVENLNNTVNALANTVGEEFDELKKQLGDILNAIKKGNATAADIRGMIGILIAQMQKVIANGDVNNAANKRIIELLENNNDFLTKISAQIQSGQISALEGFMQLMEVLNQIKDDVAAIKNGVAALFNNTNKILAKLDTIDQHIQENTEINKDSNKVLKAIKDAIDKIRGSLDKLSATQQTYFEKLLDAIAADTAVNSGNGAKLDAILALLETINKNIEDGNEAQQKAADAILEKLGELNFNVVAGMDAVLQAVVENGAQINERMTTVIKLLEGIKKAQQFGNEQAFEIGNQIMALLGTIGFTVSGQLDAILNSVNNHEAKFDDIKDLLVALNEKVENNGAQAHADAEAILAAINDLIKELGKIGGGMAEVVAQAVANGESLSAIKDALDDIKTILKSMAQNQKEFFEKAMEQAVANGTKLDDLAAIAKLINKNIVSGTDNVVNAVNNNTLAVNKAVDLLAALAKTVEKGVNIEQDILDKLDKLGVNMADEFAAILNAINNNGEIGKGLATLLNKVLAKMDDMNDTNKQGFKEVIEAIKGLADAINNLNIPGGKDYEGLLKEIINKLGSTNVSIGDLKAQIEDLKKLLADINDNVVKGNETKEKILEVVEKLGAQFAFHVDRIINAFKDGNDAVLAKLDKILAKLEVLDDNQKKILQAIKDHNVNVTVDPVTVEVKCECNCNCGANHNPNEGIIGELTNLLNP